MYLYAEADVKKGKLTAVNHALWKQCWFLRSWAVFSPRMKVALL